MYVSFTNRTSFYSNKRVSTISSSSSDRAKLGKYRASCQTNWFIYIHRRQSMELEMAPLHQNGTCMGVGSNATYLINRLLGAVANVFTRLSLILIVQLKDWKLVWLLIRDIHRRIVLIMMRPFFFFFFFQLPKFLLLMYLFFWLIISICHFFFQLDVKNTFLMENYIVEEVYMEQSVIRYFTFHILVYIGYVLCVLGIRRKYYS
jgi:hypothetical protein